MLSSPHDTDRRLLRLSLEDNVCAVTTTIEAGESIAIAGRLVKVVETIPCGHKMAIEPIPAGRQGDQVRRTDWFCHPGHRAG